MKNGIRTRTLSIVKPGFFEEAEEIKKIIVHYGFDILIEAEIQLSYEDSKEFYAIHQEKAFFNDLVEYMSSDVILIMVLEKKNAVEDFRNLLGNTNPAEAEEGTIRAIFGKSIQENACHGSDTDENATKEICFFFNNDV